MDRVRSTGFGGREINQIIAVNHERAKPQFRAPLAKARSIAVGDPRNSVTPHSRTGRKYLQRICAQAVGDIQRAGYISGNGRVDSNANAAVFPGGNFGCGDWFGTIFVSSVERQVRPVIFFRHSLRLSVW